MLYSLSAVESAALRFCCTLVSYSSISSVGAETLLLAAPHMLTEYTTLHYLLLQSLPNLQQQWVNKADALGAKIATTTEEIMQRRAHVDAQAACVGAFVTFNHPLSLHRCLEDFITRRVWWRAAATWWREPQPLLFQGRYKLRVRPAPEPDNVVCVTYFSFVHKHA
jgi:hypothetical protein